MPIRESYANKNKHSIGNQRHRNWGVGWERSNTILIVGDEIGSWKKFKRINAKTNLKKQ
jgi:hypothetical protein